MTPFHENLTLENDQVLLRPLRRQDFALLHDIAQQADLWDYFTHDLSRLENFQIWSQDHFDGKRLQFVLLDKSKNQLAGSSGFGNFSARDQRVEIGWTWLGKEFQGKDLNSAVKKLMLAYAFEQAGMKRVEFKTDVLNLPARQALKKLGAIEEGVLRSHTLLHHGRRRDTIYYSFLEEDWAKIS
ncbi:GNAT family N-acetyltransferase [Algoriphagus namhaensis]